MTKKKLSSVDYVVNAFGGVRATARALGISASSVSNWKSRSNPIRQKGSVPAKEWSRILSVAGKQGLNIKIEHLMTGKSERKAR